MNAPDVWHAADALAPMDPVDWLCDGVFSAGSVSVAFGAPGSKKTWSMLDLAVCVALGQPWLGHATKQSTVLIIDEESGKKRILRRVGDVIRGHLADASVPIHGTSLHGFNFFAPSTDTGSQALETLIRSHGAAFVIMDALADVMLGGDENAVKDTQKVFHALRQVAEATGAAILLIHHANKVNGYRGSTAIAGAIDLLLQVESKQGTALVNFETTKARDTEPAKFAAECHWQPGQFWLTETQAAAGNGFIYTKAQRAITQHLLAHPTENTFAAIEQALRYAAGTVRSAVADLMREGVLRRIDGGKPGVPGIYEVDPLGLADKPL